MHETIRWIALALPAIVIVWLLFFMRQITKGLKPFERSTSLDFDDIRSRAELQRLEQKDFQAELLTELRRHNAALERQTDVLGELLQKVGSSGLSS